MILRALTAPFRHTLTVTKIAVFLIAILVFSVSVYVIAVKQELRLIAEFQAMQRVNPLPKARALAASGEYCEALEHLDYYRDYDYVRNDPEVTKLYNELKAVRESALFRFQDIWRGVWRGKGACTESLVSATVADFLVVGDVRDLIWGAVNTYYGEETDMFTIALAGAGLVLAGATYGSGGGAAPVKGSVSLLKLAKRMGKLPKSLQRSLVTIFREVKHVKSIRPFVPVSRSIYRMSRIKGFKIGDFLEVIARCRRVKDIGFMENVAKTFGKRTRKFLKIGGDDTVDLVRRYGKTKGLAKATDSAVQYGPDGIRLLKRAGPSKFMRYLKLTKYSVRGVRSIWKQRLTLLLAETVERLPDWGIYMTAAVSGLIAGAIPSNGLRRAIAKRKARREIAQAA